ncbi:hypothetical protein DMN57_15580 [Escherichia coli]|nr:hypothetical protein [Escherichia coli]
MSKAVAVIILSLVLTIKSITATGPGAKTAARHARKAQMRHQLHCQMLCTGGNKSRRPRKSVKSPVIKAANRQ